MNMASPEAKVGLFTIIAFLILFILFFWLSGVQLFQRGSELEAVFDQVEGLRPGAPVKFVGVDVGRVSRIYFDNTQVVVAMRIKPDVKIPKRAKVIIASSGVIGDKYLEIVPAKPGELLPPGKRLLGQNPISMEQFYNTAYDVLESLRIVADSIKYFITDPEISTSLKNTIVRFDQISADFQRITGQLQSVDLVQLFNRVDHIALMVEEMARTNQPQINELIANITKVSAQLAEASVTANRFLNQIDNNGQTATDLKQTLANAEKISANLERFTAIIANKDQDIELLINDAHETMQAIKEAAQNINQAVEQLTTGDGTLAQVKQTIDQTSQAAEKVNNYVTAIEQISLKNSLGARYQKDSDLMVDYRLNVGFNEHNSLLVGWEDVGQENLTVLQWGFKSPRITGRLGVFKSKFGVGLDIPATSFLSLGIDAWDTTSPNYGLTSNWQLTPHWSMSLGGETNVDTRDSSWSFECWRQF